MGATATRVVANQRNTTTGRRTSTTTKMTPSRRHLLVPLQALPLLLQVVPLRDVIATVSRGSKLHKTLTKEGRGQRAEGRRIEVPNKNFSCGSKAH